jgi:hypothetical protein
MFHCTRAVPTHMGKSVFITDKPRKIDSHVPAGYSTIWSIHRFILDNIFFEWHTDYIYICITLLNGKKSIAAGKIDCVRLWHVSCRQTQAKTHFKRIMIPALLHPACPQALASLWPSLWASWVPWMRRLGWEVPQTNLSFQGHSDFSVLTIISFDSDLTCYHTWWFLSSDHGIG